MISIGCLARRAVKSHFSYVHSGFTKIKLRDGVGFSKPVRFISRRELDECARFYGLRLVKRNVTGHIPWLSHAQQRQRSVDQETLLSLFDYDCYSGVFTRLRDGRKFGLAANQAEGYVLVPVNGKTFMAHRLAWLAIYGEWPDRLVDHIDGNKANNAITNLRLATCSENTKNWHALRLRKGVDA